MSSEKFNHPPVEPMGATPLSRASAAPVPVRAHHLLCAVCVRGGCATPPCGRKCIDGLLATLWDFPHVMLRIEADLDAARAHFNTLYEGDTSHPLPDDCPSRTARYAERRKDLEVCRLLGIYPNSILPAYHVYTVLFGRIKSVRALCGGGCGADGATTPKGTAAWPACPHAARDYFADIAGRSLPGSLENQYQRGEELADETALWTMIRPRTKKEMADAKRDSADFIAHHAKKLYIRPNHLLCILCQRGRSDIIIEDNLIELRDRMEADPDIPVVVTEGCCMVCDPCQVYHPGEHVCYHAHPKNVLRDLMMLQRLDLRPGVELPARELYKRIYDRIGTTRDICAWDDELSSSPFWAVCGGWKDGSLERARNEGWLQSGPRTPAP